MAQLHARHCFVRELCVCVCVCCCFFACCYAVWFGEKAKKLIYSFLFMFHSLTAAIMLLLPLLLLLLLEDR